jgi:hypothetical protein
VVGIFYGSTDLSEQCGLVSIYYLMACRLPYDFSQYVGSGQQSVALSSQIIDAPEALALAVLGIGLCALGFTRRARPG